MSSPLGPALASSFSPTMSSLHIKSILFNPGPDESALKLTAKCYTSGSSDPKGLTLLCAHGAGTHKEQWEPTLEQIFRTQENPNSGFTIYEVWSVDWQSHGAGATVNEAALLNHLGVSVEEWAQAIAAFVKSPHLRGRRLVGVGHSAGSSVVLLATRNSLPRTMPFAAMIIVEPVMCSKDFYREHGEERDGALSTAIVIVNARRQEASDRLI